MVTFEIYESPHKHFKAANKTNKFRSHSLSTQQTKQTIFVHLRFIMHISKFVPKCKQGSL